MIAACGTAAALALSATLVVAAAGFARVLTASGGAGGDFLSFYAAGDIVRHGGAGLYDARVQAAAQQALYPGEITRATGYPLPVAAAWLFAPLSILPFQAAFALWTGFNIMLAAVLSRAMYRSLGSVPVAPRRMFVATFALSVPMVTNLVFGQVDLLIFGAMLGAHALLRPRREYEAGALLAVVVIKPQFLMGVVPMLLVRRRWRAAAALAACGAAVLVVPALLTSPALLWTNARFVAESYPGAGDQLQVMAGMMANWRGFMVSITGDDRVATWLPGLAAIGAVAFASAIAVWRRAAASASDDQSYALAVMLPLVASPHLHTQSLVLMFIPLALLLRARLGASSTVAGAAQVEVAVTILGGLYVLLFACWVMTAVGLSFTVFLLAALYGAMVLSWPAPRVAAEAPARETGAIAA